MITKDAFEMSDAPSLLGFFKRLFSQDFMPHGHCYFWRADILWLNVFSDLTIALAYFVIPVILIYFVWKRKNLPFPWMFSLFGAFIVLCGMTHVMDIYTTWWPVYRVQGLVKLMTAIVSLVTAGILIPLIPKVLSLKSPGEFEELSGQLTAEIFEHKKSEESLRLANKQLSKRAKELSAQREAAINLAQDAEMARKQAEQAEAKVQETAQIKSEFTSIVSHELRTPLTVIKESIGILEDGTAGPVSPEQKVFLETAKRNIDRLARLVNNVLDFQKLETKKMEIHLTESDINQAVRETKESLALVVGLQGFRFVEELEAGLPPVRFDRDMIVQVLTNFLSNSMKVMEKGKITFRTKRLENTIRVSVEDQGPGIKKEDIPKLFKPFSQLITEGQRKPGSTGLGLAICKQIIDAHHGKIGVETVYGKGAAFYFILPIMERRNR